jgi:2-amino-4-hydroxy-6-hydroxymethyldihydropteridine diphosphokinase
VIRAFIGLGANLGDARAALEAAIAELAALPSCRLAARSSLYLTGPVAAQGPDFINAVVALDTALGAPCTLDLDLLAYGQSAIATPDLCVPHPRMTGRAFVLVPLDEIAPGLALPGIGKVRDHLPAVADQRITRLPG